MEELHKLNEKCVHFLNKVEKEKWTQAYDKGFRYGCMTTNIVKSINWVFKRGCMLPITTLVQLTFYKCVAYFERHRTKTQSKLRKCEMYTSYAKIRPTIGKLRQVDIVLQYFIKRMRSLR